MRILFAEGQQLMQHNLRCKEGRFCDLLLRARLIREGPCAASEATRGSVGFFQWHSHSLSAWLKPTPAHHCGANLYDVANVSATEVRRLGIQRGTLGSAMKRR